MSTHVVQISAGTGPAEVRRFVAQLAERLEALCEARGLVVREVISRGAVDPPASIEILVQGDAFALLADQRGTHALIARSSDRGKSSRKRWFAGVSVHPITEATGRNDVALRDLEIEAITSPGPGGQHVNKTATSVRVRHVPSGIVVRVSDERSQRANLRRAIERIGERLRDDAARRRGDGEAARRAAHYRVERGAAVMTYRMGPRGELELGACPSENA